MIAGLLLALVLISPAADTDTISRHELEARAHNTELRLAELKAEIEANQRSIEANQQAIAENQRSIAELRGRLAVWGTILTVLTGSGLLFHVFTHKRKDI